MAQTEQGAIKVAARRLGISAEEYTSHLQQGEKWCYKCRLWKSVELFAHDKTRGDGRKAFCRTCEPVYMSTKPPRVKRIPAPKPLKKISRNARLEQQKAMLPEEDRARFVAHRRIALLNYIEWEVYTTHLRDGDLWCRKCKAWKPRETFKDGARYCTPSDLEEVRRERMRSTWVRRKETFISPLKGRKMSEAARQKMRDAAKNRANSHRVGQKHTPQARAAISQKLRETGPRGQQIHSYKDGKSAERRGLRYSQEYKRWRYDVYSRDKFTCQQCGDNRGGNLIAHHIKPFAEYPELRVEVSNGLTLCGVCHNALHQKKEHKQWER